MLRRALALVVVGLMVLGCQDPGDPAATQPLAAGQIEGPYTSGNLTVWLIKGDDTTGGREYLTLSEAMDQKKLLVHETGNVNTLVVENVSDDIVFIPAGSIVKGGKQDRTLGTDLIIAKKDGKVPIDAFCVEQGRWQQRGQEHAGLFAENSAMVSGKAMKMAANSNAGGGNQGQVWESVSQTQTALQQAAAAEPAMANAPDFSLTAAESPTSFQLTMETEAVKKLTDEHRAALLPKGADQKRVVGYVYAVNNQIAGGNVYASPKLFGKMWPMLLDSAIVEAVAERAATTQPAAAERKLPANDEVLAALNQRGEARKRELNDRTIVRSYDGADSIMLETTDTETGAAVSRQLLIKPEPGVQHEQPPIQRQIFINEPMQQQELVPNAPAE